MREIMTTIEIAASPERVWRVLTDFASYPKWNPFIRSIEGRLQKGSRLSVRMQLPRGGEHAFSPVVVKAIPGAELRWRGKLFINGLFDGEHVFLIVPQGRHSVRFIQREQFSGWLVPLVMLGIAGKTRKGFKEMNRALKNVAEAK